MIVLFIRQINCLLNLFYCHGGQLLWLLDFELTVTRLVINERIVVGQLITHLQVVSDIFLDFEQIDIASLSSKL
jgi:hypothetical protein